jgi:hypothetical protein
MTKRDPHGIDPDEELKRIDGHDTAGGVIDQLAGLFGLDDTSPQALQKQRAESTRRMKREANIFRDTFATDAGRKCLAIMREMTIDTAPYPAEAMLSLDAITPLVIAHDAQCRFVRSIEAAIAQADNDTGDEA